MKVAQMPVVKITTADGEVEVKYSANMRFADFARHNAYDMNNLEIANEHYKAAKAVFADLVEKELAKVKAVDAKQSAVAKGNGFKIRTTIVKEQEANADSEQHRTLITQWANKKAVESQKAQERASVFLAAQSVAAKAA